MQMARYNIQTTCLFKEIRHVADCTCGWLYAKSQTTCLLNSTTDAEVEMQFHFKYLILILIYIWLTILKYCFMSQVLLVDNITSHSVIERNIEVNRCSIITELSHVFIFLPPYYLHLI